jgi:SAM-dependent methyltransferase
MALTRELRRSLKSSLLRLPAPVRGPVVRGLLRGYESYLGFRAPKDTLTADEQGLPLPPAKLRVLVAGKPDVAPFLSEGRTQTRFIADVVARNGKPMESMGAILDFGCGCGRLVRHWATLSGPEIHATDYNRELVGWVDANLPFVRATFNELEPPLRYPDASFDLVYALSVFTHLPEDLEQHWVKELRRVLRPGGFLFFTAHGESYFDRLVGAERDAFRRGEGVSQFADVAGTNLMARYHPPSYVRNRMLPGFEVVDGFEAHMAPDTADAVRLWQDAYLARATA